jgi:hypothetical protein
MNAQSVYIIPCECGVEVRSHAPTTTCEKCGRLLVVELRSEPSEAARAEEQHA